VRRNRKIVSW